MLHYLVDADLARIPHLCHQAGECYAAASRAVLDEQLSMLFTTLSTSRRAMAMRLSRQLHLGACEQFSTEAGIAGRPEDFGRRLFGRLRAVLGNDERRAVIEGCERMERALARSLADACETPLPADLRRVLRKSLGEVLAGMGLLAAARVRLS